MPGSSYCSPCMQPHREQLESHDTNETFAFNCPNRGAGIVFYKYPK